MRKTKFYTNQIYHIYNRGIDKRDIFLDTSFYHRFISILEHYLQYDYPYSIFIQRLKQAKDEKSKKEITNQLKSHHVTPTVEIISFCLMPNHYHLTLRQLADNGITEFMHKIGTSFTNYFNIRLDRTGRLFEGPFKAKIVTSEEQLIHLTRYHHINPTKLLKKKADLVSFPWSSLPAYLGDNKRFQFVKPDIVLSHFKDSNDYLDFVLAQVKEAETAKLAEVAIDDDFKWFKDDN